MTTFPGYEVLGVAGVGGTGTVYQARHVQLGRLTALKEVSARLRADRTQIDRLRAEAHVLAALDDPHVVAVYEFVEERDRAWIAEEWVTGAAVATILASGDRFTAEQALGVVRHALMGLMHAHERKLLHRDVSTGNILADLAGNSKLVDFGLAAPVGEGGACGTPAFASPEATRGEPLDKRSDVYSAAAVLFALLAGHPPFAGKDAATVMRRHREDPVPTLTGHGPDLADLLQRALAKDRQTRPADAATLLAELEEAAQRRYGADWLTRASIAGLVAAATGGAVGTAAGPAGTATGGRAAETDGSVFTGPAPRPTRRTSRALLVAGVAAAVVVTGTVGALAVAKRSSSHDGTISAGGRTTGAPTPGAGLSDAALSASAPSGVYRADRVITASTFVAETGQTVGSRSSTRWTIRLSCAGGSCTGNVTSTEALTYRATYDGTTLTLAVAGTGSAVCFEPNPTKDRSTIDYVVSAVLTVSSTAASPSPATGPPAELSGTLDVVNTTTSVTGPGCLQLPPRTSKSTVTLTKVT
jgi:hypothetical protein